jgi:preprotein translocase subunit SecE
MTTKVENAVSRLDGLKWAVAATLLALGLGGFYYLSGHAVLARVVGLLALAGGALAVAMQTAQGRQIWDFLREARTEVRKVVWPTRKETVQTTSIVFAMVTAVAIFLWLLDMFLAWGVRSLIGHGG